MKKYLSVFGLFAQSSIYKILGIILLMILAETGLFAYAYIPTMSSEGIGRFEHYIDTSHINLCLAAAFILITVILCLPGTEFSSKVGYTLRRLSVSEKAVFFCQAIFNTISYLILWAVQVGILYAFSLWYTMKTPIEFVNNQSIFLAFYRSEFLHTILPLSEVMLWIRNILLFISLGFASAEFPYIQRRRKHSPFIVPLSIFMLLFFVTGIGGVENIVSSIFLFVIVVCKSLYDIYHKEESYDK